MSQGRLWWIIIALMVVEILGSLETAMIFSVLPVVTAEFKDIGKASWLVTGFILVTAGAAAIGGRLGDMFGRRRAMVIVVALSGAGSLVSAMAPTLDIMILGRAIQGASGAIMPLAIGIAREHMPREKVPLTIGLIAAASAGAAALGYLVAGAAADSGRWQSIFEVTALYAAAMIPLILLALPRTTATAGLKDVDFIGGLLFVPAIAGILFGVTSGPKTGWGPTSWVCLLGGLALLAFWAWHELRIANPLIDVRLFGERNVLLGNVAAALLGIGVGQLGLLSMMLLQQPASTGVGLGIAATAAALYKIPSNGTAALGAPISGYIFGRWGGRPAVVLGGLFGVASFASLTLFHGSPLEVMFGVALGTCSYGMLLAATSNLVVQGAPLTRSSEAAGLCTVTRGVFGGVGAQAVTVLLATSQVYAPDKQAYFPGEDGYRAAFLFLTVTLLLTVLTGLLIRGRREEKPAALAPASAPAQP